MRLLDCCGDYKLHGSVPRLVVSDTSVMSVSSRLVLWLTLLLAVFRGCSIMAIVKPMVRSPMVKETVSLLVEGAAKVI